MSTQQDLHILELELIFVPKLGIDKGMYLLVIILFLRIELCLLSVLSCCAHPLAPLVGGSRVRPRYSSLFIVEVGNSLRLTRRYMVNGQVASVEKEIHTSCRMTEFINRSLLLQHSRSFPFLSCKTLPFQHTCHHSLSCDSPSPSEAWGVTCHLPPTVCGSQH